MFSPSFLLLSISLSNLKDLIVPSVAITKIFLYPLSQATLTAGSTPINNILGYNFLSISIHLVVAVLQAITINFTFLLIK